MRQLGRQCSALSIVCRYRMQMSYSRYIDSCKNLYLDTLLYMLDENKKQFISFYDSDFDAVYRFCVVKTHDKELAKDLAQDAFLKSWEYVIAQDQPISIRPLVYKIANNAIIDWYRKKKDDSLDTLLDAGFDPAGDMRADEEASFQSTLRILEELNPEEQELILMRYVNGMPPREIAEYKEESTNAVTVRIHRARNKLKKIIKDKNYELF